MNDLGSATGGALSRDVQEGGNAEDAPAVVGAGKPAGETCFSGQGLHLGIYLLAGVKRKSSGKWQQQQQPLALWTITTVG